MSRKHSLHTFVHRTLVYRLIAVGLTLSFILGLTVLFIERDRVSQEAIDIAIGRIAVFADRYEQLLADPDNLDPKKMYQAIIEFRSTRSQSELGAFVYVGAIDAQGKIITELFGEQYQNVGELKLKQKEVKIKSPGKGHDSYEIFRIAGLPHLRIALPLVNNSQKTIGFVSAVFAFSDQTIDAFRLRGLRAMISAVITVLLTTAILYPVILRLNPICEYTYL